MTAQQAGGTEGERKVRLGMIGTSWWADAMYLPAMVEHPRAEVVAICGRRQEPADQMAERWSIPRVYTDPEQMLADGGLDAVVIATANNSHHQLSMAALKAGLHVLCEKPLAMTVSEAEEMARAATEAGVNTLVPFTYRWMPMMQWLRRLVAEGYVGQARQISVRYFSGYGLEGEYAWRFDPEFAGETGIIGDLGSHIIHLARWLIDDTETEVSATTTAFVPRGPRPDDQPYEQLEDSAVLVARYRSGASGVLQATAAAWEGNGEIGQLHQVDIHGDAGTLHAHCDWDTVQEVRGSRFGQGPPAVLPIPDDLWGDLRRRPVPDTYRDVFRTTPAMTRGWIQAIAENRSYDGPGFGEGLAVQRVMAAAAASARDGGRSVVVAS